ncbi:ABC transporter ATP-binding protein [Aureimonas altamirensis]|uniref:ABC transporter ATP-binding protein n=1 Tax=Aureimonas altamirensis TaxID=370622 RepID=UPI00301B2C5B
MPYAEDPPVLSAQNIRVSYGPSLVLDGLDIAIPSRAFTALIGPNGSGKSTLLKTLAGLVRPEAGSVFLDNQPLAKLSAKAIARRIGVLAQAPVAPDGLTVQDLVRQGRYPHRSLFGHWTRSDDDSCEEAMALTDVTKLRDRPLSSLSGGQRQRAWIAMTLAQQTPILLLDEPTTYLDVAHQIDVMELIDHLVHRHGKTVVAVLHDLNQASRYATNLVAMRAGAIVVAGRPVDIVTQKMTADVFDLDAVVVRDPLFRKPMVVARGRMNGGLP